MNPRFFTKLCSLLAVFFDQEIPFANLSKSDAFERRTSADFLEISTMQLMLLFLFCQLEVWLFHFERNSEGAHFALNHSVGLGFNYRCHSIRRSFPALAKIFIDRGRLVKLAFTPTRVKDHFEMKNYSPKCDIHSQEIV